MKYFIGYDILDSDWETHINQIKKFVSDREEKKEQDEKIRKIKEKHKQYEILKNELGLKN